MSPAPVAPDAPDPVPRYISPGVAAAILGVTPRSIRNYIAAGRLTGYRLGTRTVRLSLAEVQALPEEIRTGGRPR